jgi:RNA polymerase sigma-70 factor (ECF subfamily)
VPGELSTNEDDRLRLGTNEQFAALIARYSPRVRRYAARFARDADEVQDLLQDTWYRAFERRGALRDLGSFESWLFTVCRTVCVAHYRQRERHARLRARYAALVALTVDDARQVGDEPSRRQLLIDAVSNAVMELSHRQRIAVISRVVVGMSTAHTAQLMGCAEGTVKATLHQALGALRTACLTASPAVGESMMAPVVRRVLGGHSNEFERQVLGN